MNYKIVVQQLHRQCLITFSFLWMRNKKEKEGLRHDSSMRSAFVTVMLLSVNIEGKVTFLGLCPSVNTKKNWGTGRNKGCIYFMLLFLISQDPKSSWVLESLTGNQGKGGFERCLSVCVTTQCLCQPHLTSTFCLITCSHMPFRN